MERQGRWMMRFSIRNLVLAITALAIAWHVFQCHYRPYRLVKDLQEDGVKVEFNRENLSWFTRCLSTVLPESSVLTVKSVRLTDRSTKSFDYSRLRHLELLQELELMPTTTEGELFPNLDFTFLDHLQHLKTLKINFASIDTLTMEALIRHKSLDTATFLDCSFRQLEKPPEPGKGTNTRLQAIGIAMSWITKNGEGTHLVEWLNQFQSLRELRISSLPLTDDDFERLAPSPKLKRFNYFVNGGITLYQLQALREKYPNADLDVSVNDPREIIRAKFHDNATFGILQPEQ